MRQIRRRRSSFAIGAAATLVVASPFAALSLSGSDTSVRPANETETVSIPTQIASVVLASVPDIVIPVRQLTGLDLPDLRLSDLKRLPLPKHIPMPDGLGLPSVIELPPLDNLGTNPQTLPPEIMDRLGATVKELTRNAPFSMVALTGKELQGATALVRPKLANGAWGSWHPVEQISAGKGSRSGSEPIFVGKTSAVQVLVTKKKPAAAPEPGQTAPAQASSDDMSAVLIQPGSSPTDANLSARAKEVAAAGPKVITRQDWGADEALHCEQPTYDNQLRGATVHHTGGRSEYTKEESPGIVRAIYAYHAQTLHWCDVGYNALVDKYGQIFEGRAGGLDKPVEGAHAGGFNDGTVGVALIGNYSTEAPTPASVEALGKFLGWRLKAAGLDPKGRTSLRSVGSTYTSYPDGANVDLPVIFAHRDVGLTDCPGDAAYAQMDQVRDIAARAAQGDTHPTPVGPNPGTGPGQPSTMVNQQLITTLAEQLRTLAGNPIVRAWAEQGGPNGTYGPATSGVLPTDPPGAGYAKFTNGYVFDVGNGDAVSIIGKILETFVNITDQGVKLGVPLANEYLVPEGMRQDFQNGSLVFNQITGFVTTILKTFTNTYTQEYNNPTTPN